MQKFIDPKGDHNFIIRLHWSPKLCILEKTINKKKIYDKRFNLYERAVTYDGEEFQTETEAIRGNNIPDRFEKIGSNIASHISNITLERIKIVRMILNFKIGKNDKIYFLWCSSLRIENFLDKKFSSIKKTNELNSAGNKLRKKGEAKSDVAFISSCDTEKIQVTYPNSVNLFQYSNQGKPIKVYKSNLCKNCDNKVEQHKICDITFRTLVEAHDSRKRDKEYNKFFEQINMTSSGVELLPYIPNKGEEEQQKLLVLKNYKNLLMPKVIFALYPKLNYDDYKVLKKDTVFLSKNTQVCEKCFLDLTKYCNFSGSNTHNVLRVLKATIPDDFYIKKTGNVNNNNNSNYNNSDNLNTNLISAFNSNFIRNNALSNGFAGKSFMNANINNTFYNVRNLTSNNQDNIFSKKRSKTPGFGFNRNDYNNNNKNNDSLNNMRNNKTDLNTASGNMSFYNNTNKSKNKYKPDFSSKIKFVIEPKKDSIQNNQMLVKNKERVGMGLNALGNNASNNHANQQQMSLPSSSNNVYNSKNNIQNIENDKNNNNNSSNLISSANNQIDQNAAYAFSNAKNESMNLERNENKNSYNALNNLTKQSHDKSDTSNKIKRKSLSRKNSDSEISLNMSNKGINITDDKFKSANLNNNKLASNVNNNFLDLKPDNIDSKINYNQTNVENDHIDNEQELDNKVKCEVLEADKDGEQNSLDKKKLLHNYIFEKDKQAYSESDDEEDGHDNQSENGEDKAEKDDIERKIGEEINV